MRSLVPFKPDVTTAADAAGAGTLAPIWRKVTMFNPLITLIGACRNVFGGSGDTGSPAGVALLLAVLAIALALAVAGLPALRTRPSPDRVQKKKSRRTVEMSVPRSTYQ
jgi:hypothetical protein